MQRGLSFTAFAAVLVAGSLLAACGSSDSGGGGGKTIALLLPEAKTARYESQDRPKFEARVKQLCSDCKVIYSNADQDPAKQQQQAEAALTKGANVLVLDAVDAASAGAIVTKAKAQKVPVVSYDRLITNADIDYYISYDNEKVGKLQSDSLSKELKRINKANGPIPMINGAPTDNNAKLFKAGATAGFKSSGVKVAKSFDTPDWSPDKAQTEMDQAITSLGKNGFAGVYAANDGTAGGAIAAMKGAGIDPKIKPTTGQDAELAAIQRILTGEQFMTVYKDIGVSEAPKAAELAVAAAKGDKAPSGLVNQQVDNGKKKVPSVILDPVAVTKDQINDTIVKDKWWTASQICTGKVASACKSAGIQ